jgi:hypothetical protein
VATGSRWVTGAAFFICGCTSAAPTSPTSPPGASEPAQPDAPNVDRFEYVAGEEEVDDTPQGTVQEETRPRIEGDFALTTADAVHALAEEAVAERLNPKQQWEASPVLPRRWPSKGAHVGVYFYPMAVHPNSTSRYELFSAAWFVSVSLVDGAAEVSQVSGRRRLGTLEITRPSLLERSELAIAEQALVETVLGGDTPVGENNYWGYLKYFREHPQLARDIGKRAPAFVKWLHRKQGSRG